MTPKPDRRLLCCAGAVKGDIVLDVGTDHALLPCYLVESGRCRRAIASDVAEGPLLAAKTAVERAGLGEKISVYLSDGFIDIPASVLCDVTDVVIAGMGGELIIKILSEKDRLPRSARFILQPNTRASLLRKYLSENGFLTDAETAVEDGKFVYAVISGSFSGDKKTLTDAEAAVGRLDPRQPATAEYIRREAERLFSASRGMNGSRDGAKRAEAERLSAVAGELLKMIDNAREDSL